MLKKIGRYLFTTILVLIALGISDNECSESGNTKREKTHSAEDFPITITNNSKRLAVIFFKNENQQNTDTGVSGGVVYQGSTIKVQRTFSTIDRNFIEVTAQFPEFKVFATARICKYYPIRSITIENDDVAIEYYPIDGEVAEIEQKIAEEQAIKLSRCIKDMMYSNDGNKHRCIKSLITDRSVVHWSLKEVLGK